MSARFRMRSPLSAVIIIVILFVTLSLGAPPDQAPAASAADCVSIGTPKPALSYTYQQSDSVGGASEFTDQWEEFTKTGSRLLTSKSSPKGPGVITSLNRHRVVDDVLILDSSTQTGTDAGRRVDNSTSFQPGVVADPAYRACAGRTWPIPSVMATNESAQGRFSAATPAGTLTIKAIRESVTVPAGRFDTVHYTRLTGQSADEYWKSTEHGVTVKRTHTMPGGVVVTATLHTIK
jgi:hypothetical protein